MKKQKLLTGFPSTVFATAKRSFQAAIRSARLQVLKSSISGYSSLFEEALPASFLAEIDPTQRQRHFGHIPVFWAWCAQILEANSSCGRALSLIQS